MVYIYKGGTFTVREKAFVEQIKKSADLGKDVLVIIPDQFSFEYDKKLYENMGAKNFNKIQTLGFNRLTDKIISSCGGLKENIADENAKIIMMYKAIARFKKDGMMFYYKKYLDKANFISQLIELMDDFHESAITYLDLQAAAEKLEGSISLKLFDMSRIYKYYIEELENASMKDKASCGEYAAQAAKEAEYFKNKTVYVSAFDSFTYDQRKILDVCISQCEDFYISLLIDEKSVKGFFNHPFAVTVKTQTQIENIAAAHNKKFKEFWMPWDEEKPADIAYLSQNLYSVSAEKYKQKSENVFVIQGDDIYREAEYICAEISRLVREKGYKYKDISVAFRNLEQAAGVMESMFERYDIPYFIDRHENVSGSAIVHYINSIFKTVCTKEYKTENIMKLIKSPFFGILNYDILALEEYCIKWNVDGDMWVKPFTAGNEQTLKVVNELREKIIEPLEEFKTSSKNASAAQICIAFYKLLEDIQLSQQTYSVVKRASTASNETQIELVRNLKQIWNSALGAVKSIYECLGEENITLKQFYEIYRLMLSHLAIAAPPEKIDCVKVIDAQRSRVENIKVMFASEVVEGVFPAPVSTGGLILEREKEMLRKFQNIIIEDNAMRDFQNEKLTAYKVLTAPCEKLYILYSVSDLLGRKKRPSMLVKAACDLLDVKAKNINSIDAEFFCTSYKTAYAKFTQLSKDNDVHMANIRESLKYDEFYGQKAERLRQLNQNKNFQLSKQTAQEVFFKDGGAYVSPTALDSYFKCPFKYFCEKGLRLRKVKKIEIDSLNSGNLVHNLMEKLTKNPEGDCPENIFREEFLNMTDEQIKEFIHENFMDYYMKNLGGDFGKSPRFMFLLEKLEETAFYIVQYVQQELKGSKFRPALVEFSIEKKENADLLKIELKDNKTIYLVGKIDRADIFQDENGEKYIRIIDYKTGKKQIKLSALYNGLNLQMFVYLSQLLETKNAVNPKLELKQAGVIYFSFYEDNDLLEDNEEDDEQLYAAACDFHKNAFKPAAKITDNPQVLEAMNISKDSDKEESIVTDNMLTALRKFSVMKTAEFGQALLDGNIAAKPVDRTCEYCDFSGICGMSGIGGALNSSDGEYEKLLKEQLEKIIKEEQDSE